MKKNIDGKNTKKVGKDVIASVARFEKSMAKLSRAWGKVTVESLKPFVVAVSRARWEPRGKEYE